MLDGKWKMLNSLRLNRRKGWGCDCPYRYRSGAGTGNVVGAKLANGNCDWTLYGVLAAGKGGDRKNNGDAQNNQQY